MKLKFMAAAMITLLILGGVGIAQNNASASDSIEKVGQGEINWSAGYIEAVGIGAPADKSIGKASARPMALRAARVDAYRNLLEITKGVRVDSATTVKDFTVASDVINTQVDGLVKGAVVIDQQYMSDGTVEVRLRMPLFGNLSQVIIPASIEKRKDLKPPDVPAAPPAVAAPAAPAVTYTGLVIDARGIQARPAMSPRILDEDNKEVYGTANVDREFAVQQGMSGYARDMTAAQSNQRVTNNPITVKAIKTSGAGRADLIIKNADALQIKASADNAAFMKKCRVMIVLD